MSPYGVFIVNDKKISYVSVKYAKSSGEEKSLSLFLSKLNELPGIIYSGMPIMKSVRSLFYETNKVFDEQVKSDISKSFGDNLSEKISKVISKVFDDAEFMFLASTLISEHPLVNELMEKEDLTFDDYMSHIKEGVELMVNSFSWFMSDVYNINDRGYNINQLKHAITALKYISVDQNLSEFSKNI